MNEIQIEELKRLCREAERHFCDGEKYNECLRSIGKIIYDTVTWDGLLIKNKDDGYVTNVEV